jgi:hypothetical protein
MGRMRKNKKGKNKRRGKFNTHAQAVKKSRLKALKVESFKNNHPLIAPSGPNNCEYNTHTHANAVENRA